MNIKNHDQNTPLHYLAKNLFFPKEMPEILEIMNQKFMHFSAVNVNGETGQIFIITFITIFLFINRYLLLMFLNSGILNMIALHHSCWKGNLIATKLLIERGVNLNHPNKMGETALHWAVRAGQESLVTMLIEKGATINVKGQEGLPLDIALAALQPKDGIILALGGKREYFLLQLL